MDLLDEIQNDPEFRVGDDDDSAMEIAKISFRLSKMYMEHEALLLLLRTKDVITEEEYQKAIHHIVEVTKEFSESEEIDGEFIKNVDKKFKEKNITLNVVL